MEELINLGLSDITLKTMQEINPEILEISEKEIIIKEEILKKINCSENQIINIIGSNPQMLSRTNGELINLISYLINLGFKSLNILFDSNPYILNLDPFEIKRYIEERSSKGEQLEQIIDELDSNPILFNEM